MGSKSKKNKPVVLTRATENKMLSKFMVLTIAYMMDEQGYEDIDKLVEFYSKLYDWLNNVKDHLITINKVARIIEEKTGTKVHW